MGSGPGVFVGATITVSRRMPSRTGTITRRYVKPSFCAAPRAARPIRSTRASSRYVDEDRGGTLMAATLLDNVPDQVAQRVQPVGPFIRIVISERALGIRKIGVVLRRLELMAL